MLGGYYLDSIMVVPNTGDNLSNSNTVTGIERTDRGTRNIHCGCKTQRKGESLVRCGKA